MTYVMFEKFTYETIFIKLKFHKLHHGFDVNLFIKLKSKNLGQETAVGHGQGRSMTSMFDRNNLFSPTLPTF